MASHSQYYGDVVIAAMTAFTVGLFVGVNFVP